MKKETLTSEEIMKRILGGDMLFTQKFFFSTGTRGSNIRGLRSKLIWEIRRTYGETLTDMEASTIIYEFLWDWGTWRPLRMYSGHGTIFSFIERVARHALIDSLAEQRRITAGLARTAGNTRLLSVSVPEGTWHQVLSDVMPEGTERNVLRSALVERKSEKAIAADLNVTASALADLRRKAEKRLRERLIDSPEPYAEIVLRDKSPVRQSVAVEQCDYVTAPLGDDASPLADVFGVNLSGEALSERVTEFLYAFARNMPWSDDDRLIWTQRFIKDTPPRELSQLLGRDRGWVDSRYSRLNKSFRNAVRLWWRQNAQ